MRHRLGECRIGSELFGELLPNFVEGIGVAEHKQLVIHALIIRHVETFDGTRLRLEVSRWKRGWGGGGGALERVGSLW